MSYIDAFIVAVPTANKGAYLKVAKISADIFKRAGASRIVEAWGADIPDGKTTSFRMAVKQEPDETIVMSYITWPSKEAREKGMQQAMVEMQTEMKEPMPFDGKRMIFGSFETILEV